MKSGQASVILIFISILVLIVIPILITINRVNNFDGCTPISVQVGERTSCSRCDWSELGRYTRITYKCQKEFKIKVVQGEVSLDDLD